MTYVIEPDGWPCTLEECRPGHFMYLDGLCCKSEYTDGGKIEAYNLVVVQPVRMRKVEGGL